MLVGARRALLSARGTIISPPPPPPAGPTLDPVFGTPSGVALSGGNLVATRSGADGPGIVRCTKARPAASGVFYEYTWTNRAGNFSTIGFADSSHTTPANGGLQLGESNPPTGVGASAAGGYLMDGSSHGLGQTGYWATGQAMLLAFGANGHFHIFFSDVDGWNFGGAFDNTGGIDLSATIGATVYPAATLYHNGDVGTFNFGAGGRASFVHQTAYDTLVAAGFKSMADA